MNIFDRIKNKMTEIEKEKKYHTSFSTPSDDEYVSHAVKEVEFVVEQAIASTNYYSGFFRDKIECSISERRVEWTNYSPEYFDNSSDTFSGGTSTVKGKRGWQRRVTRRLKTLHPDWSIKYYERQYTIEAHWIIKVRKKY